MESARLSILARYGWAYMRRHLRRQALPESRYPGPAIQGGTSVLPEASQTSSQFGPPGGMGCVLPALYLTPSYPPTYLHQQHIHTYIHPHTRTYIHTLTAHGPAACMHACTALTSLPPHLPHIHPQIHHTYIAWSRTSRTLTFADNESPSLLLADSPLTDPPATGVMSVFLFSFAARVPWGV